MNGKPPPKRPVFKALQERLFLFHGFSAVQRMRRRQNSSCTLVAGIVISSFFAVFSPTSAGGTDLMPQYAIFSKNVGGQDTSELFRRLFLTSLAWAVINVLFAQAGVCVFLS